MQPTLKVWLKRRATPKKLRTALKRSGRIKPVGAKRAKENREYSKKRKAFLAAHPFCQAHGRILDWAHDNDEGLFWGTAWLCPASSEIHHMKKPKCKYLNDESTWLAVCRWSHNWIEDNKSIARSLGLLA